MGGEHIALTGKSAQDHHGLGTTEVSLQGAESGRVGDRLAKLGGLLVKVLKDFAQHCIGNDGRKCLACFRGSLRAGYDRVHSPSESRSPSDFAR
jgi:hypothetical protein